MASCRLNITKEVLPKGYTNVIAENKDPDVVIIRSNLKNMTDLNDWARKFGESTKTKWNHRTSRISGVAFLVSKKFICQHSSFRKKQPKDERRNKNSDCKATMKIKIKLKTANASKDKYIKTGLLAVITIDLVHSHAVGTSEMLGFLPSALNVRQQFLDYFTLGLSAVGAKRHHVVKLMAMEDFTDVILSDRSVNPAYRTVSHWYDQWRKGNFHITRHANNKSKFKSGIPDEIQKEREDFNSQTLPRKYKKRKNSHPSPPEADTCDTMDVTDSILTTEICDANTDVDDPPLPDVVIADAYSVQSANNVSPSTELPVPITATSVKTGASTSCVSTNREQQPGSSAVSHTPQPCSSTNVPSTASHIPEPLSNSDVSARAESVTIEPQLNQFISAAAESVAELMKCADEIERAEEIAHLAMTCEKFPAEPEAGVFETVKIKQEPPEDNDDDPQPEPPTYGGRTLRPRAASSRVSKKAQEAQKNSDPKSGPSTNLPKALRPRRMLNKIIKEEPQEKATKNPHQSPSASCSRVEQQSAKEEDSKDSILSAAVERDLMNFASEFFDLLFKATAPIKEETVDKD